MTTPIAGSAFSQVAGGTLVERVSLVDSLGGAVATLRVNAGGAAVGQSLKTYAGTVALSTTLATSVPVETVTTGKTFYITDIYIGSNTASVFSVTVNAAAVAIFQGFCKGDTGPIALMGIETQPQASSASAVVLSLGSVATATTCAYLISGYEQ